jgi:ABC-type lipoprotein release transport system permease subunit
MIKILFLLLGCVIGVIGCVVGLWAWLTRFGTNSWPL